MATFWKEDLNIIWDFAEDSEQVHKHLENPLIRDIAKLIDSSENPEQDLMGARDTHPEFEDFVRSLVKATRKKQQQQH